MFLRINYGSEFLQNLRRNSNMGDSVLPRLKKNKISDSFHSGGFLISNNIKMDFLDSFLEENKVTFEMLAKENIKKIEQHKRFKK